MAPNIRTQRDNLAIGLYLARGRFGARLDDILEDELGYSSNGRYPWEHYMARFRNAQRVGREAFRERRAGYFTFNAMPFGGDYIYKATWYVWVNPESGQPQTVPLPVGDLAPMRRFRDKDLDTREATTRSVRTADNIHEQGRVIQRQDRAARQGIQRRMTEDGSLGELLSGLHGLPYADIQKVILELPNRSVLFRFQRDAQEIKKLDRRLRQAQQSLSQQLTALMILRAGLPNNAPQMALQQAQERLDSLVNR